MEQFREQQMTDWRTAVIKQTASIEQAVRQMDKAAIRIGLVVDSTGRLQGTITDGDVRRALLNRADLSSAVTGIMCAKPTTARSNISREAALDLMESNRLIHLPVVDEAGQLVGLHLLDELVKRARRSNPVFLMAGGFGTRLRPLTEDCPKPMLKVGGTPILERIIQGFVQAGFHNFYVSTHFLPEMVKDYFGDGSDLGVSIQYTHEDEPLGTGGALGLLPHEQINEPMFMMNGDLLTNINFAEMLAFHNASTSVATMAVREYEYQVPYGVIEHEGRYISSMVEKPTHKYFVNAGVYVLSPELVHSVKRGTKIDTPTLLSQFMDAGEQVAMFPVHEYWLDIGRMEDFKRAQAESAIVSQ